MYKQAMNFYYHSTIISTISCEEPVIIITEHLLPHMIAVVQSVVPPACWRSGFQVNWMICPKHVVLLSCYKKVSVRLCEDCWSVVDQIRRISSSLCVGWGHWLGLLLKRWGLMLGSVWATWITVLTAWFLRNFIQSCKSAVAVYCMFSRLLCVL